MTPRRPRLTRQDHDNILDAMEFVLAGEFPFAEGEPPDEHQRRLEAFERTRDKIVARL